MQDLAVALLPQSWLEEVYDGIWLTILEAGRWDEEIGSTVSRVLEQERDLIRDLVDPPGRRSVEHLEGDVELLLALVQGLRATHAPLREVLTADRATIAVATLPAVQRPTVE